MDSMRNEGRIAGLKEILEMLDRMEMEPHMPKPAEPPAPEEVEAAAPESAGSLSPEDIELLKAKLAELGG